MYSLNETQNLSESIDKLAAQNQLYGDAKELLGYYLVMSIFVILILNLLVKPAFISDWFGLGYTFDITNFIAIYALALSVYEICFLKNYVQSKKQKAAKIQEDFDCTVYGLDWNNMLCGERVCASEIEKYSRKYTSKGKSRDRFVNWYTPDINQISGNKQIRLCQKENLGWDVSQRKSYMKFLVIIALLTLMLSLVSGLVIEVSLKTLILSAIIPTWPIFSFAIQNIIDNNSAITDKTKLKYATEIVEQKKTPSTKYTRQIQDLIYLNRMNNNLIFDWYYNFYRESNQSGVSYASRKAVSRIVK
jgi:hypothetical protein